MSVLFNPSSYSVLLLVGIVIWNTNKSPGIRILWISMCIFKYCNNRSQAKILQMVCYCCSVYIHTSSCNIYRSHASCFQSINWFILLFWQTYAPICVFCMCFSVFTNKYNMVPGCLLGTYRTDKHSFGNSEKSQIKVLLTNVWWNTPVSHCHKNAII